MRFQASEITDVPRVEKVEYGGCCYVIREGYGYSFGGFRPMRLIETYGAPLSAIAECAEPKSRLTDRVDSI